MYFLGFFSPRFLRSQEPFEPPAANVVKMLVMNEFTVVVVIEGDSGLPLEPHSFTSCYNSRNYHIFTSS